MNVVGYIRSATNEGSALQVQEAAIRAWCEREGHTVLAVYVDKCISGIKLDRPGLAAALAMVEGYAEALVVYRLDRLARDLILQETIIARLDGLGRKTLSTQEDVDGDDPTRMLVRQVLDAVTSWPTA